jgi:hypothetical protein
LSAKRRTYLFIALPLIVWGLLASLIAGYYFALYTDLSAKTTKPILHVNIGLRNGNSTITWFNGTSARAGDSLLTVTLLITNVNYTEYPISGAFINSINGVANHGSLSWIWWTHTSFGWSLGQIASDKYIVSDGETCVWYFEDTTTYPQLSHP